MLTLQARLLVITGASYLYPAPFFFFLAETSGFLRLNEIAVWQRGTTERNTTSALMRIDSPGKALAILFHTAPGINRSR